MIKLKKKNSSVNIILLSKIVTIFLFVIISAKLVYVAVSPTVDGIDLKSFALSRTTTSKTIEADRGNIYDVNGEVLAKINEGKN